ncbi:MULTISPECIES: phosphoadenylyl-sulfate reductase [Micrococcaceae]|uniref:phosphoadenylyl-sulfate reductase n=1 Tax=Micrococcaceae TaxID=1268 RepID=UPI000CFC010E|nr:MULTISPECIES: phosphoadenylyl-sulfate reductase [unclassified Arthrobacter]MCS3491646.1 phosphoadenosine phosphosulfate reductase [Arthrobacter sp. JUb119]PQZ85611.1 phosphoadenylyl-sulfate reductase [Arthrobacter sp. MYb222]TDU29277.1 phosphoadenylylsulfate reductase (thioredoxin) [Arthrobacter sp. JUb115]
MSKPTPVRTRSEAELRRIAKLGAAELGWDATADQVVAFAAEHLDADEVAVACSMADAVLPHLVCAQLPKVDVLFLETGYHFAETHGTRDEVARTLDVNIVDVLPALTVAEQDAKFGKDLFSRDPAACCQLRKMDPLARSLSGYSAWFTGVRRDEAETRINTPLVAFDEKHGLVKFNPVAPWSFDQLIDYATGHQVPVNLLLSNGYPSIGCQPCTRPVAEGEDPRAGRWAGLNKTECGIHV